MSAKLFNVTLTTASPVKIIKWKVKKGMLLTSRQVILIYHDVGADSDCKQQKFRCMDVGTVRRVVPREGDVVQPGDVLLEMEECSHSAVMNDMCAECGADLRKQENVKMIASVPMVHSIPELKVSQERAEVIGREDKKRLIENRKLVLLVDLDQTLVHTTNDNVPVYLKDVCHFQLHGKNSQWHHTRIRPGTRDFLKEISNYYELHICSFGARNYAHFIASYLDPDGKYFSQRILSRDEFFSSNSKTANLKALFPCGDELVCIIDDREDVWNFAANLVKVRPYHFFQHTGDINAPPGLAKDEDDETEGFDFSGFGQLSSRDDASGKGERGGQKEAAPEEEPPAKKMKTDEGAAEDGEKPEGRIPPDDEPRTEGAAASEDAAHTGEESDTDETDILVEQASEAIKRGLSVEEFERSQTRMGEAKDDAEKLIDIDDEDDYLIYLEEILKKIHQKFYEEYDGLQLQYSKSLPDLKVIIPQVRKSVLRNCRLVFSGMIPNDVPLEQTDAHNIAVSLGALVLQGVSTTCTHLVAAIPGTAKVTKARKTPGTHIVTPLWLWHCSQLWKRMDEKLYPLGKEVAPYRKPPPHCGGTQRTATEEEQQQRHQPGPSTSREKFKDTINPLLTFSSEEKRQMSQEVAALVKEDEDLGSSEESSDSSESQVEKEKSDDEAETRRVDKGKAGGDVESQVEKEKSDDDVDKSTEDTLPSTADTKSTDKSESDDSRKKSSNSGDLDTELSSGSTSEGSLWSGEKVKGWKNLDEMKQKPRGGGTDSDEEVQPSISFRPYAPVSPTTNDKAPGEDAQPSISFRPYAPVPFNTNGKTSDEDEDDD